MKRNHNKYCPYEHNQRDRQVGNTIETQNVRGKQRVDIEKDH